MTGFRLSLKSRVAPGQPRLDTRSFDLVCLTMAAVLASHAMHLPWWLTLVLGVILALRWHQRRTNGRPVSAWLKLPLIALLISSIVATYGSIFGRDPGSAFAVGLLVLKLLESEHARDARVSIAFACFALMSALLFDQSMLATAWVALSLVPALAALRSLESARDEPRRISGEFRAPLLMLALSIPLALFAFLFVPRLSSPLWGAPSNTQSTTGLSNRMAPGEMTDLLTDDTPAMRVTFDGGLMPDRPQRYFRAYVLWKFDGKEWSEGAAPMRSTADTLQPSLTISYEISLEATHERVMPVLDMPVAPPDDARMSADRTVTARRRMDDTTRYRVVSSPQYRLDVDLPQEVRDRALRLPDNVGPKARALAASWRAKEGSDDGAVALAALALFRNGGFSYTLAPAPLGTDRIDDFLFGTHEGYCEHYASSFTFLMRAAGIPARVVTGYQGGYWNSLGNYLLVRQSDAHAWSEIWLEGRGWVRYDPTGAVRPQRVNQAGASAAQPGQDTFGGQWLRDVRNRLDIVNQWWGRGVIGFDAFRQRGLLRPFGVENADIGKLSLILVAGCSLLVAIALAWALFRPRDGDALDRTMRRLESKLARAGIKRRTSEGPRHFFARAARALPAQREALEELSRRYLRLRYGSDKPPPEPLREFSGKVREFTTRRVVK
ncbi:transglutaminase-like putative cysteine protease [Luteibacter sp. Sphag1AF]|uniref:transglutaminase TgpA family protein n=1 Tax=Luteibacter sp. Sphag1AF TaxID=2587031 RepID=UPI001616FC67|nr:DUF3488 and transglutaminase-like domain-containing protein [Luteibacter sp. Sphag1AF]MBB3226856.1 transglutaminase-like putative cysteine protease [Luteibacter sp. Sphag1AF]